MNYEKLYKNALERAREQYNKRTPLYDIEYIFPELQEQESEDEKIKKAIHIYLDWLDGRKNCAPKGNYSIKDMIAWVEKHSKEEYALKSSRDEDVNKFMQYIEKQAKAYDFNLPNRGYDIYAFAKDILIWLEKQGENKPAENVEIKFCEGDKVVSNQDGKIYTVGTAYYITGDNICLHDTDGNHLWTNRDDLEKNYHLWTLKDAKDGDVLASMGKGGQEVGIVKRFIGKYGGHNKCFETYCYSDLDGTFRIGEYMGGNSIHPATKKQCDQLFQKMKEAGYEWDADKKELKKIKVASKESEDERIRKKIIDFFKSRGGFKGDWIAWLEKQNNKLDADKVIKWLKTHGNLFPIVTIKINEVIAKFKEDFGL